MAEEEDKLTFHMKDDTVQTNVCVGLDAGFDVNGVRVNTSMMPQPVASRIVTLEPVVEVKADEKS